MELLHSVVKENGIMLLLVTHDPDIADTCDTIFEMDGGRITCAKKDVYKRQVFSLMIRKAKLQKLSGE